MINLTPKNFGLIKKAGDVLINNGIPMENFNWISIGDSNGHPTVQLWVPNIDLIPKGENFNKAVSEFNEETNGGKLICPGVWSSAHF